MSVALNIASLAENNSSEYVPLAAEQVFAREWLPVAAKLGLRWLQRFQDGSVVPIGELSAVLQEFEVIRQEFANLGREANAVRAEAAVVALRKVVEANADVEVFIG